jgi:hypothetical protein
MNKKITRLFFLCVLLILPGLALAAFTYPLLHQGNSNANLNGLIYGILNFIWPLFLGFSILMFVYAGFLFLSAQGEGGKLSSAKSAVIWGIIGIAVGILAFSIPTIVDKVFFPAG